MTRKTPEEKAQEIGEMAREFADNHQDHFPKQPPSGQWFQNGENFVHVGRAVGTYEVTLVLAEIVTNNDIERVEVTLRRDGSAEKAQTLQGHKVPDRRWTNPVPSTRRARRVFDRLHEEMKPKQ